MVQVLREEQITLMHIEVCSTIEKFEPHHELFLCIKYSYLISIHLIYLNSPKICLIVLHGPNLTISSPIIITRFDSSLLVTRIDFLNILNKFLQNDQHLRIL